VRERAEGVYLPQLSFLIKTIAYLPFRRPMYPQKAWRHRRPPPWSNLTRIQQKGYSSLQQCMLHRPAPTQAAAVQVRAGRDGVSRVGYSFEFGIIGEL